MKFNKKAFTVVESLVAISILLIGFIAVTQIFPLALKMQETAEMSTRATEIAKAKIEDFLSRSYSEVKCISENPPCQETENPNSEDPSFRSEISIIYVDPQNNFQEPTPESTDTGIKKVKVVLYWQSLIGEGESNMEVSTFIVRK